MPTIIINCFASWEGDSGLIAKLAVASPTVGAYGKNLEFYVRASLSFNLTDLPAGSTVTQVRVKIPCVGAGGAAGLWDIHPYNADGQAYPCDDAYDLFMSRCVAGVEYVNDLTSFRAVGTYWFNLGAQACTDVQNAKAAVNRFSLGLHEEGDNDPCATINGYYSADPAQLEITYEVPVAPVGYQYSDGLVSVQC